MTLDPTRLVNLGLELARTPEARKLQAHLGLDESGLAHRAILARALLFDLELPEGLEGSLPLIHRGLLLGREVASRLCALDEAILEASVLLGCGGADVAEPLHTLLRFGLLSGHTQRRAHGVFYTPAPVARWLVAQALGEDASRPLKVGDLCCGCGTFLVAAAERLVEGECELVGCDIDPVAVEVARIRLYRRLARGAGPDEGLARRLMGQIVVGDGLEYDFGGLDVAVSNPPFGNAIGLDTSRDSDEQARLRRIAPEVARGAYDLSFVFAARMIASLKEGGRYGVILPRSVLSVASGQGLREVFEAMAPPRVVWVPPSSRLFAGADVFVALLAGRREAPGRADGGWLVRASTAPANAAGGPDSEPEQIQARRGATWSTWLLAERHLERAIAESLVPTRPLAELAILHGGAATGAAYNLKPWIEEDAGPGLLLMTTGLIDRYVCLWGRRPCRYLKERYQRPLWPGEALEAVPVDVRRAAARQRAPKVLVGGLSRVIEAVADPEGRLGGVVSTWVVRPLEDDDANMVWLWEALLNSPTLSLLYMIRYRGKELSSGNTTIGRRELGALPVPADLSVLASAARGLPARRSEGWSWVFEEGASRAELASAVIHAVAREGVAPEQEPGVEAQALAAAAISRLYGLDASVHVAIEAWHANRMRVGDLVVDGSGE